MLETATTTEMQAHYRRAHELRAAKARAVWSALAGLVQGKRKEPRPKARPVQAPACAA